MAPSVASYGRSLARGACSAGCLLLLLFLNRPLAAGEAAPTAERPAGGASPLDLTLAADTWQQAFPAAVLPDPEAGSSPAGISAAPAPELATGLGLQIQKKRRKFRQRAVNWMTDVSVPAGALTDLLLGGGDSGWHLVVDPTGTDEYILEWQARFR